MSHLLDDIAEAEQLPCVPRAAWVPTNPTGCPHGAALQRNSMVLDAEVSHHGAVHKASYFVEHGVIHAKIGDSIRQFPLDERNAADTVASHLTGYLHQVERKRELARIWRNVLGTPSH